MDLHNKKIIILGSHGMLASDVADVFSDCNLILWDRNDLDITDREMVIKKITEVNPDVVINCAAYTNVDKAEEEKDLVMKINGEAVGYIALAAKMTSAILVHYSTDYVFSGEKESGYLENDEPEEPISIYGRSKLLGEEKLIDNHDMYYILRLSWLYGPKEGPKAGFKNFVNSILRLSKERDNLKVVNDQFGKPTFSGDVAQKTREILENDYPCGVYHCINEGETSWYEFAQEIVRLSGNKCTVSPCTTEEYPLPARRPKNSVLVNTKMTVLRSWKEALKEYLL
jgi:dTDP-4-dehydrorhamnose reductase